MKIRASFFLMILAVFGLTLTACSNLDAPLPSGISDPDQVRTKAGAAAMYASARGQFQLAFGKFIVASGLMSDELMANDRGISLSSGADGNIGVDVRQLGVENATTNVMYTNLHGVRTLGAQALGALRTFDPNQSNSRRGMMYVLIGYTEIMLADLFCSGVPLTSYDFDKDFTYRPGSKTEDIYLHAIALFDTALQLGQDSLPVTMLAHVGRGRAWLSIGQYDSAMASVQMVPTDFAHVEKIYTFGPNPLLWQRKTGRAEFELMGDATVANREGTNGLPFITSGDPRTKATESSFQGSTGAQRLFPIFIPDKYAIDAINPIVLGSGIEARLIEAEGALHKERPETMREILNSLRATGGMTPIPSSAIITKAAQEDTLFAERAAWLFLTGQRQNDLRRLVRVYGRSKNTVYPVGPYPGGGTYESYIDATIPSSELKNPLFHGCLSRD